MAAVRMPLAHHILAGGLTTATFRGFVRPMRKTWTAFQKVLRQGLPALALYALVLQAFLTGAAPASVFHPETAPLCAEMASGTHAPDPKDAHPDCLCLAQCLQAHASLGIFPASADLALARSAERVVRTPISDASEILHPLERGPGARAPPMI